MSETTSNFDIRRLEDAEVHHKKYGAPSAPEGVYRNMIDSWELEHVGGDLEEQASGEYPLHIAEDEDSNEGLAPSTSNGPLSPPDSNTGTPCLILTPDETPERRGTWCTYTKEEFQRLHPARGRDTSRSASSHRTSTHASYHSAREEYSPSPHNRPYTPSHLTTHGGASSVSLATGAGASGYHSGSGDVFYTPSHSPSQSPSHAPSHYTVQSRSLTDVEGDSAPVESPPMIRTPQEPYPYSVYDPHDETYPSNSLNEFEQQWAARPL